MSRDIGEINGTGSRDVTLHITRYWGGNAGSCMQLTALMENGEYGYVQLSAADAIALLPAIKDMLDDALRLKRDAAAAAIQENKCLEQTIVNDMRAVAEMAISQPVFDVASLLVFGGKKIEPVQEDRPND